MPRIGPVHDWVRIRRHLLRCSGYSEGKTMKPALLTVDDDPEVLSAIQRDLRGRYAERYRVLRAESGKAALDALGELQRRNDAVALLLVDQRMPQMTGVRFLSEAIKFFPDAKRV